MPRDEPVRCRSEGRLPLAAPVRCVFRGQVRGGEGKGGDSRVQSAGRCLGPAIERIERRGGRIMHTFFFFLSLQQPRPVARGILSVIPFLVAAQKNTLINFFKQKRGKKQLKHENNPTSQFSRANRYPSERRQPK